MFNTYVSLIMFLDLRVDSSLPCSFVKFPLGDLEKVSSFPESHLPGADHINGVFKGFVLGEFGSIYGYSLVL